MQAANWPPITFSRLQSPYLLFCIGLLKILTPLPAARPLPDTIKPSAIAALAVAAPVGGSGIACRKLKLWVLANWQVMVWLVAQRVDDGSTL